MKPKIYFLLLGLLAFVGLTSCRFERVKEEVWGVASKKQTVVCNPGSSYGPTYDTISWYIVKRSSKSEWRGEDVALGGFAYEEGFEYSVRVKITNVKDTRKKYKDWLVQSIDILEVLSKTQKESLGIPVDTIHITGAYLD